MSLKDETPDINGRDDAEGFKICLLTRAVERRRFNAIKAVAPAMTNQLYTISIKSRKPIGKTYALVSPKHCELWNLQVGCPSEKPDLSDHFLKRSPEKDKQRKWWCKVPVWRKRYYGLIRSDTGKRFRKSYAIVPPNALFVLYL